MNKREYWKGLSPERRGELAAQLGTSINYLRIVFMHGKKTSAQRARKIAEFSGGVVGPHEFCPDAFDAHDTLYIQPGSRLSA